MKSKIFSALWTLCCSSILSCSQPSDGNALFIEQLTRAVQQAENGKGPIRIAAVTEFKWDQLFIFAPYTPTQHIVAMTRLESTTEVDRSGIERRDDISLLVFLADGKLQKLMPFPRNKVDFAGLDTEGPLTPAQAVFNRQDTAVAPRLILIQP